MKVNHLYHKNNLIFRFQRYIIVYIFITTFLSLCVILPLNFQGLFSLLDKTLFHGFNLICWLIRILVSKKSVEHNWNENMCVWCQSFLVYICNIYPFKNQPKIYWLLILSITVFACYDCLLCLQARCRVTPQSLVTPPSATWTRSPPSSGCISP